MIGSSEWLTNAQREWRRRNYIPFDAVKGFRRDCLREVSAHRPRPWSGSVPWVLHCRHKGSLHPRFVAYLDKHIEIRTWRELFRLLQHQKLQWWADRLSDLTS